MWTPQKTLNHKYGRVIALIDMDCFYCQVEEQLNPSLKGKPIIVQPLQYDDYGGGGIIALNYVAKARGVKRSMRGDEAKKQCPELELVKVPIVRGKADLSKYRNAGKQVAAVLQTFTPLMTRASVDEAYLDLTERVNNRLLDMNKGKYALHPSALENTFPVGFDNISEYVQYVTNKVAHASDEPDEDLEDMSEDDQEAFKKSDIKLLIAASIVNEIRATVKEKTGYECSAGIAHNKTLAKLVCGLNKPNKQTVLPLKQINEFYRTLPIRKVQGLGGKFGDRLCEELNVQHMADLFQYTKEELQRRFDEKNAQWLYNLVRGIDLEAVTPRLVPKSISCSKMFPRQNAIADLATLKHWLHEIAKDVVERVEEDELENNRRPKQMVVSFTQTIHDANVASSRSVNFSVNDEDKIVNDAIEVIKKNTPKFFKPNEDGVLNNSIKYLGFNICKFVSFGGKTIGDMFRQNVQKKVDSTIAEANNESRDSEQNDSSMPNDSADQNVSNFDKSSDNTESRDSFLQKYHVEFAEEVVTSTDDDSEVENSPQCDALEIAAKLMNQNVQQHLLATPPGPSASSNVDYKMSYAEYYKPAVEDLPKLKCSQCDQMIVASQMQVHTDGHLAFQLNQEQRTEFQNQLKRPRPDTNTTPKKKKSKTASNKKADNLSIQKFLVKRREGSPEPCSSTANGVEFEKCAECGKSVAITELFEHMDFHAAKKLQDELMKTEIKINRGNNNNAKNSTNKNISAGKGKKSTKKNSNLKNTAVRNITAFFQSTD